MSIVVQVGESVEDETTSEYPWIGIDDEHRLIVLFTQPGYGVVMSASDDDSTWSPGDWCGCWAESIFDTFKGTVTLSN